jgi:hypothetical protein
MLGRNMIAREHHNKEKVSLQNQLRLVRQTVCAVARDESQSNNIFSIQDSQDPIPSFRPNPHK